MRNLTPLGLAASLAFVAGPVLAADDEKPHGLLNPSLFNTDFVVLIGFLLFIAILFYFNVPALLGRMLDDRAAGIQSDLDEARALREEAQSLLASYERKQREVQEQSDRIVTAARADAEAAAVKARSDLESSITRRLQAAEDQIGNAEQKAVKAVRDEAIAVAIAAARETIGKGMAQSDAGAMIDASIGEVERRLH